MARIRIDKHGESKYEQGIHLENPTEEDIQDAQERAYTNGFKTIWIHRSNKMSIPKTELEAVIAEEDARSDKLYGRRSKKFEDKVKRMMKV